MGLRSILYFLSLFITPTNIAFSQVQPAINNRYITIAAGEEYKHAALHRWLWGDNWRKEWSTPVTVEKILLDTTYGGLTPYEKAGGGETKTLRLKSASGKEYVLRSINKSRKGSVPGMLKYTAYAGLVQDGVSMSHPYGTFAIYDMLDKAGIHHTNPKLVYVPRQAALDSFNNYYGNDLYLLEERPSGDWSNTNLLGNYKDYLNTTEVRKKLESDNSFAADQQTFLKARLFDILIGDADRHEGNWKWGWNNTKAKEFIPVPVDRDQAFFMHDGLFTKPLLALTRRRFMQSFEPTIKNVKKTTLTKHDRSLDKFFTNEMDLNDWLQSAEFLKQVLTDEVITTSIKNLPPEIFAVSGAEIIEKLKLRRNNLHVYAAHYYEELSKKVEVYGSALQEYFEVRSTGNSITVNVYRTGANGQKEKAPYYQRNFSPKETNEIFLKGLGGNDIFSIENNVHGIKIRKS